MTSRKIAHKGINNAKYFGHYNFKLSPIEGMYLKSTIL